MDNHSTAFYAHSRPNQPIEQWERLDVHLNNVARRAADFGNVFGFGELARLAGAWHDLGKASDAFQQRVLHVGGDEATEDQAAGRVDHSTAGAQHAAQVLPKQLGLLLAYMIAGHHGHLPDWITPGSESGLEARLRKDVEPVAAHALAMKVPAVEQLLPQKWVWADDSRTRAFQQAFLTRMLFSTLVDADWLETERFVDHERAAMRLRNAPAIAELIARLNRHLETLVSHKQANPAPVDRERAAVLAACRMRATEATGWFSLTVPTGGGKTFSSLAFALEHAAEHGLQRVIYAMPFTSIIEQNADAFRQAVGDEAVLEHHSNLDPDNHRRTTTAMELATENWDAPLIVTTNIQLFESLFASHKTRCRKLHRIAGSVIVLDEAQTMQPGLLRPCLAALDELVRNYRCTIVLCTATQPAVKQRADFEIGIKTVREIVDNPRHLFHAMERVDVEHAEQLDDCELASRLRQANQALCIVNTKNHARGLAQLLDGAQGLIHLSAAMCPAHRSEQVALIRHRLIRGEPCIVISTQVIEAGVDVDFPVVFRALAGFDSIAQAAGRCNREGRLDRGRVVVFETNHKPPMSLQAALNSARQLIHDHPNPLTLEAIEAYFTHYYWQRQHSGKRRWDDHDVLGYFQSSTIHQFRQAADAFQWIRDRTHSVIVPYGDQGRAIVDQLRAEEPPDWKLTRRAQRYTVAVRDHVLTELDRNTTVQLCHERFWVLTNPDAYDLRFGLQPEVIGYDPASLQG